MMVDYSIIVRKVMSYLSKDELDEFCNQYGMAQERIDIAEKRMKWIECGPGPDSEKTQRLAECRAEIDSALKEQGAATDKIISLYNFRSRDSDENLPWIRLTSKEGPGACGGR